MHDVIVIGAGPVGYTVAARARAAGLSVAAVERGCSCRTCTSGRARNGCGAVELLDHDEPGFWETYGYHIYGDPWREQRYAGD